MIGIYTDKTIDILREVSESINLSNYQEIAMRCPYCGDSKKNKFKKRFYISKNKPVFTCFNCNETGSVFKLLKDLGININGKNYKEYMDIELEIKDDYDYYSKKENIVVQKEENQQNDIQIEYLYNRLKIYNFDKYPEIEQNVIYNVDIVWDKLKSTYSRFGEKYLNDLYHKLKNNTIGFLSNNKNKINFRNIINNDSFRYMNLKLTNDDFYGDYFGFYGNEFIQNLNIQNIIISEGPFDILNYYINHKFMNNSYYHICAHSNNFGQIIKYILMNFDFYMYDFIILIDNDYNYKHLKYVYDQYNNFINKLYVYNNRMGKDFGEINVEPQLLYTFD